MDLRSITVPLLQRAFVSFEEWFLKIVSNRRSGSPEDARKFNQLLEKLKGSGFTWLDPSTKLEFGIKYDRSLPSNAFLISTVYLKGGRDPKAPGRGSCDQVFTDLFRNHPPREEESDPLLNLLTRRAIEAAYRKLVNEQTGIRTFVDEKADKGISDPNQPSSYVPYESPEFDGYRNLSLPSGHPKSREKRIQQPAYNTPGDGSSYEGYIPAVPGDQYGHPYIDQGTTLHKRRAIIAGSEPHLKIQAIVDQLHEKGVLDEPIQVLYYGPIGSGEVQIQLFTSDGERVGFFFTGRVAYSWDSIERLNLNPECKEAYRKIRDKNSDVELWSLDASNLKDKRLWNKGIGKLAYEQILKDAGSYGAVVVPHWCLTGGSTSNMAKRVWDSLKRRYKSEGPIVIPKTLRLASLDYQMNRRAASRLATPLLYHYSDKNFSRLDPSKGSPSAIWGSGVYLSDRKEGLEGWSEGGKKEGYLYTVRLKPSARMLDITKPIPPEIYERIEEHLGRPLPDITKEDGLFPFTTLDRKYGSVANAMRKIGFDVMRHRPPGTHPGNHYLVVNPRVLQIKDTIPVGGEARSRTATATKLPAKVVYAGGWEWNKGGFADWPSFKRKP